MAYIMAIFPSAFFLYYVWTGPRTWYAIKILLTLFCILLAIVGCGFVRNSDKARTEKEGR